MVKEKKERKKFKENEKKKGEKLHIRGENPHAVWCKTLSQTCFDQLAGRIKLSVLLLLHCRCYCCCLVVVALSVLLLLSCCCCCYCCCSLWWFRSSTHPIALKIRRVSSCRFQFRKCWGVWNYVVSPISMATLVVNNLDVRCSRWLSSLTFLSVSIVFKGCSWGEM